MIVKESAKAKGSSANHPINNYEPASLFQHFAARKEEADTTYSKPLNRGISASAMRGTRVPI